MPSLTADPQSRPSCVGGASDIHLVIAQNRIWMSGNRYTTVQIAGYLKLCVFTIGEVFHNDAKYFLNF